MQFIGAKSTTKLRSLGSIRLEDYQRLLARWKVPDTGSPRAPTLVEVSQAELVLRVCRLVSGKGQSIEEMTRALAKAKAAPATPAASAMTPSPTRRVKLSAVASQVDETEVPLLSEADLVKMYSEYEKVFGVGERPQTAAEQLTAICRLLGNNLPPFADFAVFGPFGHRLQRDGNRTRWSPTKHRAAWAAKSCSLASVVQCADDRPHHEEGS